MRSMYELGVLAAFGSVAELGLSACSGTVNVNTEFISTYYGDTMTVPAHTQAVVVCKQPNGQYQTQVPASMISSTNKAPGASQTPSYDHSNIINVPLSMFPVKDQDRIASLKAC